jgi:ferredoxin
MAYKITDACINCGACESACPSGAIKEGDGVRVIDAGTCVDCGACASACPPGAIVEG